MMVVFDSLNLDDLNHLLNDMDNLLVGNLLSVDGDLDVDLDLV